MDVSVFVITYNQEKYIRTCLDSILSQQCEFDCELIIADDCSSDNTRNICIEYSNCYPEKIKLLLQEKNKGLMLNYSNALNLCTGKYIAFCAGDDYWCDNYKLQKQYDFLQKNDKYGFCHTNGYVLYENGDIFEVSQKKEFNYVVKKDGDVSDFAMYGACALAPSIFFRRNLLQHIDFLSMIEAGITTEDYPLFAIFSNYTSFKYLPDCTCVYRILNNSICHTKDPQLYLHWRIGYLNICQYLNNLFPEKHLFFDKEIEDAKIYLKMKMAYFLFNYKQAKILSLELKTNKYRKKKLAIATKNIFSFYVLAIIKKIIR